MTSMCMYSACGNYECGNGGGGNKSNIIENFEGQNNFNPIRRRLTAANGNKSCYGAKPDNDCLTCGNVVDAYIKKNWDYKAKNFDQCIMKNQSRRRLVAANGNKSCYGANKQKGEECITCGHVIDAYIKKGWKYDPSNFDQCKL